MGNLEYRPLLKFTLIWLVDLPMLRGSTSEAVRTISGLATARPS